MARRGVFKIINKRTGKVYIGSSNTNLDRLIYSYWQRLYSGDHHNNELQADFNNYGKSNFTVEIVRSSCRSEEEVRLLRDNEIYKSRHNTYNEDVPVYYGGGNPHGEFGGYHEPRNNIMDDLIGIIDKSNLDYSYKNTLKSDVKNGNITNKKELNNKINFYQKLPGLLNILDKSNLKQSEKDEIGLKIKNGSITNKNQLNDVIMHYQRVKKLLISLDKSNLKQYYKDEIVSQIKDGDIKNENQLNNRITFYKQLPELLSILDKANLKPSYKSLLRTNIRKGIITSKRELNNEIEVYEILSKYDFNDLSDQYCSYSNYSSWKQKGDIIIFKNSETKAKKPIPIVSLQKEIDLLKHEILYSPPHNSKSRLKVYKLAKIICDALYFNSYDLHNKNLIIFDDKYKFPIKKLEDIYCELDLSDDNNIKIVRSTLTNYLNRKIKADNFHKTMRDTIIEYCETNKIPVWDLINRNYALLIYDDYFNIISIKDIIGSLDKLYKEFNSKSGPLKNIYYRFIRAITISEGDENDSVIKLLNILSESELTIATKLEVKKDINKGSIHSEDSLNDRIESLMDIKYQTSRRKLKKASTKTDSKKYYNQDKTKKENKNKTGKTNDAENGNNNAIGGVLKENEKDKLSSKEKHENDNKIRINKGKPYKICLDCHEKVSMAATICRKCRSSSFVYDKNSLTLLTYFVRTRASIDKKWEYVQMTDEGEVSIYAGSMNELKNKVLSNNLPWED